MGWFGRNSGGEIAGNEVETGNETESIEQEPLETEEEQLESKNPEGIIEPMDGISKDEVADKEELPSAEQSHDPDDQLSLKEKTTSAERFRDSMKIKQSPEEIRNYNAENGYPQLEERKAGGVERQLGEEDPRWEAYNDGEVDDENI